MEKKRFTKLLWGESALFNFIMGCLWLTTIPFSIFRYGLQWFQLLSVLLVILFWTGAVYLVIRNKKR